MTDIDDVTTAGRSDTDAQALAEKASAAMWTDDAASQGLGMTLDEVRPGFARMTMRVRADMVNGHAICHAGSSSPSPTRPSPSPATPITGSPSRRVVTLCSSRPPGWGMS
jgi:hypothetical protein